MAVGFRGQADTHWPRRRVGGPDTTRRVHNPGTDQHGSARQSPSTECDGNMWRQSDTGGIRSASDDYIGDYYSDTNSGDVHTVAADGQSIPTRNRRHRDVTRSKL